MNTNTSNINAIKNGIAARRATYGQRRVIWYELSLLGLLATTIAAIVSGMLG